MPFIREMQVHMAKRFYVVDIKHQSVVGNLDRIAMKRLDVDLGSLLIAGRSRSSMMMDKVAVHGLINEIIAPVGRTVLRLRSDVPDQKRSYPNSIYRRICKSRLSSVPAGSVSPS